MDPMYPSPSFNIPSIGTPSHTMEDDQFTQHRQSGTNHTTTNEDATQLMGGSSSIRSLNSLTGNTSASVINRTPQSLLSSPAASLLSSTYSAVPTVPRPPNLYAPCASPQSLESLPATPQGPIGHAIVPQLQNIVSTVNLGVRLDLKLIAMQARNAEYNPKRFAAVIMRIRQPRTTALIFGSGKMVCTGAKSEEDSRLAARKYARIIQKLGFAAKFTDFKIQNIVGSCDVKFAIRLEGLVLTHSQFTSYEPELFPGLIYRMLRPRVVLLIFVSGKVVLTGAKVRQEIYEAFENIHPILKNFRKQ